MSLVTFQQGTIILDASCVISLYATQRMSEILAALPPQATVATYVAQREALCIRGQAPEADAPRPKLPIQLDPLIGQGLLQLVDIEGEREAKLAAYLASQIRGQGEVVTGAIGIGRQWGVVTDDRRARHLLHATDQAIQLLYTSELIRHWVETMLIGQEETAVALQYIRTAASFVPHKNDPHHAWWQAYSST